MMNRRNSLKLMGMAATAPALAQARSEAFVIRYVLSSAVYGDLPLDEVLAEIAKTGAESVDIWRLRHANHREQITEMGDEEFQGKLLTHEAMMSISTCYPLGPFGQDEEMPGFDLMNAIPDSRSVFGAIYPGDASKIGAASRDVAYRWIRRGHYKLIVPQSPTPWGDYLGSEALFKMSVDPKETEDLSELWESSRLKEELRSELDQWWNPSPP